MPIRTKKIGEGLLPNRYWVAVSNNHYYFTNEAGGFDRINGLGLLPVRKKAVRAFPTYDLAHKWVKENLYLGMHFEGITVNCVTIMDFLSSESFCLNRELSPADDETYNYRQQEALRHTIERMTAASISLN
jgi:hypothetical protein